MFFFAITFSVDLNKSLSNQASNCREIFTLLLVKNRDESGLGVLFQSWLCLTTFICRHKKIFVDSIFPHRNSTAIAFLIMKHRLIQRWRNQQTKIQGLLRFLPLGFLQKSKYSLPKLTLFILFLKSSASQIAVEGVELSKTEIGLPAVPKSFRSCTSAAQLALAQVRVAAESLTGYDDAHARERARAPPPVQPM